MTRKFSEARRQAFLDAVRETGNQSIAAERAKVSRWVQLHRATDPAFKAEVAAAVAAFRYLRDGASTGSAAPQDERGASNRPPGKWAHFGGEELVVRGTGGSGGGKRVQIARARLRQWTARVEDRFLAVLAATCNVRAACAEVGMTAAGAYNHRTRWPAFAARWDAALSEGCLALEAALLEAGANLFSSDGTAPAGDTGEAPAISGIDASQALHLLYMHKHYLPRPGRLPGRAPTRASEAETAAALERLLAQLERRKKRKEKEAGKGRGAVS